MFGGGRSTQAAGEGGEQWGHVVAWDDGLHQGEPPRVGAGVGAAQGADGRGPNRPAATEQRRERGPVPAGDVVVRLGWPGGGAPPVAARPARPPRNSVGSAVQSQRAMSLYGSSGPWMARSTV